MVSTNNDRSFSNISPMSRVTCFCVGCKKRIFYDEWTLGCFSTTLTHAFSAKQDISNSTLCQECVGTYSEEEQQQIIRKKRIY